MQKSLLWGGAILALVFAIFVIIKSNGNSKENKTTITNEQSETMTQSTSTPTPNEKLEAPELTIDKERTYTATLTTSEGNITIELFANKTPITVNNFVFLANKGFYNGTIFHRIVKGFMIQGGDPNGNGTGGPGYKFDDESFDGEYTRGTVAMANSGPNTNGSQFFIMHKDYPLSKNYVIFGKVTSGLEVVDKIAEAQVKANPFTGEVSSPANPVTVSKVEITEK